MKKPLYYKKYYQCIYDNKTLSKFFDNEFVVNLFSFFQKDKIYHSVLREIKQTDCVLILGISFGDFAGMVAEKAHKVDVLDISENMINLNLNKYEFLYRNLKFYNENFIESFGGRYDVVICNNVLHEVPNVTKSNIINNALGATKISGKTIFVDYHMPSKYFILRYFIRMFNRLYQPFAEKLWDKSIETFAKEKHKYVWKKTTFFYRCYQKVVVKIREINA